MNEPATSYLKKYKKELFLAALFLVFQFVTLAIIYYLKHQNEFYLSLQAKIFFLIVAGVGAIAPFLRKILPDVLKVILMAAMLLGSPYFVFKLNEVIVNPKFNLEPRIIFWNCLFLLAVYLVFWGVTHSFGAGIFIGNLLVYLYYLTDYYLVRFRKTPLYFSDLLYYKTALGVSGKYTFLFDELLMRTLYTTLLFSWLAIAVSGVKLKKKALRIGLPFVPLIVGCCIIFSMTRTDLLTRQGYTANSFIIAQDFEVHGLLLTDCISMQDSILKMPEGYSVKNAKDIMDKYAYTEKATSEKRPNLIVVMNESFTDPDYWETLSTTEECIPFFNSMKENTVRGTLVSSVLGGNTPNSEYEMLTGNTMAFFPNGYIPFQQSITTELPSLASKLKQLGYSSSAIHLNDPSYWNRNRAYPLLGFDSFTSLENSNPDHLEYFRWYISDKSSFAHVIEAFEQKEQGSPTFVYNVTIQNHGGYTWGIQDIRATNIDNGFVDEYCSVLRISDSEFEKLIQYFENVQEPTVVCMFGDHQPFLYDEFYDTIWADSDYDETYRRFLMSKVPFIIWANYDIEAQDVGLTSINYLTPMLLKAAGMPMSAFDRYLLSLQKKVPVISGIGYVDDSGQYVKDPADTKYADAIKEYEYLQYYYVNHDGSLNFFELQ